MLLLQMECVWAEVKKRADLALPLESTCDNAEGIKAGVKRTALSEITEKVKNCFKVCIIYERTLRQRGG